MRIGLLFVLFLSSFSLKAQLSLEECQELARKNYPLIKQFDLIDQSREYTLSNANKTYLPQLNITAIGGVIDGFPSIGVPVSQTSSNDDFRLISIVEFRQTIWDGGITKASKNMASINAEIQKADVEVSLYELKQRVSNIYFSILLINEQLIQLNILLENLTKNLEFAKARADNGVAFESDVDEIKIQLISTQQKIEELTSNKLGYLDMLTLLTATPINDKVELVSPALIYESNTEVEINRPEMSLFSNQIESIESKSKLDRTSIYPKLGLMGFGTFLEPGIAFGPEEMSRLLVAGVSLSWEFGSLYNRGRDKKINALSIQMIENKKEAFVFSTKLQLSQQKNEILKYQNLIDQDEEILLLRSNIKKAYEAKYNNGVCTITELLHRINDESLAKQNLIRHNIEYQMALYNYQILSGNL